jgi:hypothetical protein
MVHSTPRERMAASGKQDVLIPWGNLLGFVRTKSIGTPNRRLLVRKIVMIRIEKPAERSFPDFGKFRAFFQNCYDVSSSYLEKS